MKIEYDRLQIYFVPANPPMPACAEIWYRGKKQGTVPTEVKGVHSPLCLMTRIGVILETMERQAGIDGAVENLVEALGELDQAVKEKSRPGETVG